MLVDGSRIIVMRREQKAIRWGELSVIFLTLKSYIEKFILEKIPILFTREMSCDYLHCFCQTHGETELGRQLISLRNPPNILVIISRCSFL